jgi:hypothetical protein
VQLYTVNILCFWFMEVNRYMPTLLRLSPGGWQASLVFLGSRIAWDTAVCIVIGILLPLVVTAMFEAQHRYAVLQECRLAPEKHMGRFWWTVYRTSSGALSCWPFRLIRR